MLCAVLTALLTGALPWQEDPVNTLSNTELFNVNIALKRRISSEGLGRLVSELHDPTSEVFLQHKGFDEMKEVVHPGEEAVSAVVQWLGEDKVVNVHPHGDNVAARMTVAELETLLKQPFKQYTNPSYGLTIQRMRSPTIPPHVARYIDVMGGFTGFPLPPRRPMWSLESPGKVNPTNIRDAYNITKTAHAARNIQAIAEFQSQFVSSADLSSFCQTWNNNTNCTITQFIGNNDPSFPGDESMLDTEYIMSVGDVHETWVYSQPDMDFCNDLIAFGANVTSEAVYPFVISISYGTQSAKFCDTASMQRFSEDIQKMAAMGITTMIASGDSGAAWQPAGPPTADTEIGTLIPSYPASIPTAVAVGSTFYVDDGASGEQEATKSFGSGGGFSYNFPVQPYQQADIQTYYAATDLPKCHYNNTGRGTPDVSALGQSFTIVYGGSTMSVSGTSASTPTFAAIVTLLNDVCLEQSGKSLGFVNQLFYENPGMFTDIVKGNNKDLIGRGWDTAVGWDAVTGLGTPNFPKMVDVVKQHCAKARR